MSAAPRCESAGAEGSEIEKPRGPFARCAGARPIGFIMGKDAWKLAFSQPAGCWGRRGGWGYLGFRAALFVVWTACCVHSFVVADEGIKWFTKLTHWGGALQVLYFGFALITTWRANCATSDRSTCPWYASVAWCMGSTAPVISILICVLFWVLVFNPENGVPGLVTYTMHGGNVIATFLDLFTSSQPYRMGHVYAPMFFGIAYIFFTYLYYVACGDWVYSVMNWAEPGKVLRLTSAIIFVVVPVCHIVLCCLVALRRRCGGATSGARDVQEKVKDQDGDEGEANV